MRINHTLQPIREYHKAKRLLWDPRQIDLSRDRADWQSLDPLEQDMVCRLLALFLAGEEAVTHDLAPLLLSLRREGSRLEEEMFLTTQLFEEAKHVEFFDRWLDEVLETIPDFDSYLSPSYRTLFFDELQTTLSRPLTDPSRAAQAEAVATYHMIIEGVLAETGYYAFGEVLAERQLMAGLLTGVRHVQQDEARHIGFGVYLLQRLVREEPELLETITARMNLLLPLVLGIIGEAFAPYGENPPFGLTPTLFFDFAAHQFSRRLDAITRAAG